MSTNDKQTLFCGSKDIFSSGLSGSFYREVSVSIEENLNLRTARRRLGVVKLSVVRMAGIENEEIRGKDRPFAVLFVCLGNICRSPTAEAVFAFAVRSKGLTSSYRIDSAGTINYHEGDPADARMRGAALKRGVKLTSISRPIRPVDFEEFDLILAMDRQNHADILTAHRNWSNKYSLPPGSENKVKLMCSYCRNFELEEVPDPYYGGPEGFEQVLDLLEDACGGLLESLELQGQTLQT